MIFIPLEKHPNPAMKNILHISDGEDISCKMVSKGDRTFFKLKGMTVCADRSSGTIEVTDQNGEKVFSALAHELKDSTVQGEPTREAKLVIDSPENEYLYGLGQFQDGYLNVKDLTRRLTQVNTQISLPLMISSRGYGILWNNYGLTHFNPADRKIKMERAEAKDEEVTLDVTSTEGNRRETRRTNDFKAVIDIAEDGRYAILLDVGQKMARRHNLSIDGNSEAFSTIEITWDDAKRKLTIGKRNGSFEGMKAGRTFKAAVAGTERSIRYNGRKVTVEFQDQPSWSSTDF